MMLGYVRNRQPVLSYSHPGQIPWTCQSKQQQHPFIQFIAKNKAIRESMHMCAINPEIPLNLS